MTTEEVVWQLEILKGFVRKHTTSYYTITTKAVRYVNIENNSRTEIPMSGNVTVAIMNRHRGSSSIGGGTYLGRGMGGWTNSRKSESRSIGDVMIMLDGEPKITIPQVHDPQGIKNLITEMIKGERKRNKPSKL